MPLPLETGITRGKPRDVGGAGKPAPRAGVWPWRAVRSTADAGQPADVARRGRAGSPPSHTWRGPSSFLRPYPGTISSFSELTGLGCGHGTSERLRGPGLL